MPLQPDIALGVQGPNLNTLGSFLDLGRKKLELDKARETYGADVSQRQAESSSSQSEARVNAANVQPRIQQQAAQTGTAQAQMSEAQLKNARSHLSNAAQELQLLVEKPDLSYQDIEDSLKKTLQSSNAPLSAYAQAAQSLPPPGASPDVYRQYANQKLLSVQQATEQLGARYPAPAFVNTGQQAVPVAGGNPALTGIAPGTPQGTPVQMQLPPTATTVGAGGQPQYVGPQASQGPVPAGLAPGVASGIEGPVKANTDHYQQTISDAAPAQTRISALQTIRQEAPQALTGGGDWKRKVLLQLSGAFGIKADEQTANDVMAKNLSVLAQNAGNTDAARSLGEMGNPNVKMTKEAIEQTANQLIGIEKTKIAKQQAFSGIPTNSPEYSKRMALWSRVADPRLFEYAGLDDSQKAAFIKKLSSGQRADLALKAKALHDMGVEP